MNSPQSKLTPPQKEVLKLMCEGWELGSSAGWRSTPARYWLQKGGIGHSGETKRVRANTVRTLHEQGYIHPLNDYASSRRYRLGVRGTEIAQFNGWLEKETA